MRVEVAYALPERQWLIVLDVAEGTTAAAAVAQSGLLDQRPELAVAPLALGIFGLPVAAEHRLRVGDRVEIYRPLLADPKEVRRQLAAQGRTMGRRRVAADGEAED